MPGGGCLDGLSGAVVLGHEIARLSLAANTGGELAAVVADDDATAGQGAVEFARVHVPAARDAVNVGVVVLVLLGLPALSRLGFTFALGESFCLLCHGDHPGAFALPRPVRRAW